MTPLEMAEALDAMPRDVSSWEADFLSSVLDRLRDGRELSPKQDAKLRELYGRYLGDEATVAGEEEVDEDDFA